MTFAAAPVLERYYLNGSAVIGLFFSGDNGNFPGGYSRRYLREGSGAGTYEAVIIRP